jgi:hypothetical protein
MWGPPGGNVDEVPCLDGGFEFLAASPDYVLVEQRDHRACNISKMHKRRKDGLAVRKTSFI